MERRAEAVQKFPAWAGTVDAYKRIVRVADDLISDDRTQQLVAYDAETERQVEDRADFVRGLSRIGKDTRAAVTKRVNEATDEVRERRQEGRDKLSAAWQVSLTATEKELDLRQTGEPAVVLDEADFRAVQSLRLTAPNDYYSKRKIRVDLSRQFGVEIRVEGDDANWVRQAISAVKSEVSRGVSWWAHIRRPFVLGLLTSALNGAVVFAVYPFVLPDKLTPQESATAVILGLIGVTTLALGFQWLFRRLVPGFEIYVAGSAASGARTIGFIASTLLAIGIGVLVNVIT